jgi:hypothetical protein
MITDKEYKEATDEPNLPKEELESSVSTEFSDTLENESGSEISTTEMIDAVIAHLRQEFLEQLELGDDISRLDKFVFWMGGYGSIDYNDDPKSALYQLSEGWLGGEAQSLLMKVLEKKHFLTQEDQGESSEIGFFNSPARSLSIISGKEQGVIEALEYARAKVPFLPSTLEGNEPWTHPRVRKAFSQVKRAWNKVIEDLAQRVGVSLPNQEIEEVTETEIQAEEEAFAEKFKKRTLDLGELSETQIAALQELDSTPQYKTFIHRTGIAAAETICQKGLNVPTDFQNTTSPAGASLQDHLSAVTQEHRSSDTAVVIRIPQRLIQELETNQLRAENNRKRTAERSDFDKLSLAERIDLESLDEAPLDFSHLLESKYANKETQKLTISASWIYGYIDQSSLELVRNSNYDSELKDPITP